MSKKYSVNFCSNLEKSHKVTYSYKKYSVDWMLGYSENILAEFRETGTYRASETEIEFTPENGSAYTVLWEYDQDNYALIITYWDGASVELHGLYEMSYIHLIC